MFSSSWKSVLRHYAGFDTDVDAEVTIDGETIKFKGIANNIIPDAVLNKKQIF